MTEIKETNDQYGDNDGEYYDETEINDENNYYYGD